ncbi:uroporphyrinogen-III C-methyltransferase [Tumidithrix elongata RA019]|uniref:uroporphyrinogen-III C-methyltransferase n=1 Tax=Tumidithrix elongata BACA0141 TaxID=2716417 RepID=A0AAW9PPX0_9CYAN|nr:uroporphyrinogen-III C-methyltransferase [Tumidithrix elongata RA019]
MIAVNPSHSYPERNPSDGTSPDRKACEKPAPFVENSSYLPPVLGKVFIVGAGIGGVEYLTVKAHQLLSQADAIVYDALADESLLQLTSPSCLLISVGKRGGQASIRQADINQILIEQCQQGKQIVRLKSGDPWVFGRSVAEIQALYEAKCEFELVPGISSAIAAPLLAGIPLTDTESSPCFAVMTGHDLELLPWQALHQMPTLVILMGTLNLRQILDKLLVGKVAETPIAIVQWCGRPEQQIWIGTLADILTKLPDRSLSPAVIVVGDVVQYHTWIFRQNPFKQTMMQENEKLNINDMPMEMQTPQKSLPLLGKRILVTRAAGQSSQFTEMLTSQGAEVLEMPTLAILPPTSWSDLDSAIANLENYDWLILTSANAVESFFERLRHAGKDSRSLHKLKLAVVGQKTADILGKYGIAPDLIPPNFIADALIETFLEKFPTIEGTRILFPRVQSGGREILIEQFKQQGAAIDAVPAYESGCPREIDPLALQAIQTQKIDVITFASSKTVKHFCQLLSGVASIEVWQSWLLPMRIASIGPQTSLTCRELLGRIDCEAEEYTLEGLTAAITKLVV